MTSDSSAAITRYTSTVEQRLVAAGFTLLEQPQPDESSFPIHTRRVLRLRLGGICKKFVMIVPLTEYSPAVIREHISDLRAIMRSESLSFAGIGETTIGYLVLPATEVDPALIEFILDDHDPQDRSSYVFPIGVELESRRVFHVPIPRFFDRMAYSEQTSDARSYFFPQEY